MYWFAPNTTCAQQIFQVHSTQADELINSMFVYVPIFGCYGTHHVIWGGWGDKRMSHWPGMSMGMSFAGLTEQLKFYMEVSKTLK